MLDFADESSTTPPLADPTPLLDVFADSVQRKKKPAPRLTQRANWQGREARNVVILNNVAVM